MSTDLWRDSSLKDALEILAREDVMRESARLALEGRFGQLSADVVSAINESREPMLRDVLAHSGTDTLDQVRARLGLGPATE